jgi:hypothetical protein
LLLCGWIRIAPGRISRVLLFQLYCCAHVPAIATRLGDVAKIDAELRGLEGTFSRSTGTRPAEQFARPPLKGLWKKHYLVGGRRSFAMNVKLGGGKKGREFRRITASHYNPDSNHLPPGEVAGNIARDVVQLYVHRARMQELTGEWIVFAKHEGKNHYLCLAGHDEGDDHIFARIRDGCAYEFPFLSGLLNL